PYNRRYTGLDPVDGLLCIPVSFQSNFHPDPSSFADFMASWATPVALTFIETTRSSCSTVLAFPAILGLFYKTGGAGVILPPFWLALVLSGHTCMDCAAARVDQARAEAALFAVMIGFAVPSALLLTLQGPVVTTVW
ncbi:hypothetical protein BJV78DRAFT_1079618, partial [Lactifluus subvellereus]